MTAEEFTDLYMEAHNLPEHHRMRVYAAFLHDPPKKLAYYVTELLLQKYTTMPQPDLYSSEYRRRL